MKDALVLLLVGTATLVSSALALSRTPLVLGPSEAARLIVAGEIPPFGWDCKVSHPCNSCRFDGPLNKSWRCTETFKPRFCYAVPAPLACNETQTTYHCGTENEYNGTACAGVGQ